MSGDGEATVRVVVGGVSGSGKSTVGRALAERLGVRFEDGDDLHPEANRAKMRAGQALEDADRRPWLLAVADWLAEPEGGVIACSALTRAYRDLIRSRADGVDVLMLDGDPDVIRQRQSARGQHFMPASLMASQFATYEPLEPDERGMLGDIHGPVEDVVAAFVAERGLDDVAAL